MLFVRAVDLESTVQLVLGVLFFIFYFFIFIFIFIHLLVARVQPTVHQDL